MHASANCTLFRQISASNTLLPELTNCASAETDDHPHMPQSEDEWDLWRQQCRRQLQRSIEDRMRFGWFRVRTLPGVHIPREPYRSFETMKEYRDWCEQAYPAFYGYARAAL